MKAIKIINAILIAVMIWGVASWVDIIADNNEHNPQHADWNLFKIALELTE